MHLLPQVNDINKATRCKTKTMANDLRLEMVGTEDNLLKKGFVEQVSFQS